MTTQTSDTLNNYPIEQAFKSPFVLTALLVFIPSLLIYWFFGDSSEFPRSLKLFFGNWISPIILWFFAASFFHLILKKGKLKQEQAQTNLTSEKLLPALIEKNENFVSDLDSSDEDTQENLLNDLQKSASQNNVDKNNLLLTRLSLFLNHHDNNVDETFGIKEREQMRGSFSLSRFMVWAIPILGFIGTVWGISNGIAHFSDAMTGTDSVTDVSSMLKENLPLVTNSLATAFDTTLLALLLSIPLMMLMISLEKTEEAYLIDLDERWFHNIKPHLSQESTSRQGQAVSLSTTSNSASIVSADVADSSASTKAVAKEIKLLSTQIKALQETMEDLYEATFTANLNDKSKK